ncbi:MAG: hypothetical protein L0226_15930, partial [Acidobacteria bacterium]|nr:hypothetical protein [Acidobacteriota bacterium]
MITTPSLDEIRKVLPDAWPQNDGSTKATCIICETEDHPNKPLTIFANGAISCVRAAAGGTDFNREHCAPIREMLGFDDRSDL